MGSIIRRLRINSLKAKIEASRVRCGSLVTDFEKAPTDTAKTGIANRYDEALKQTHSLQLLLELLEKHQTKQENVE